MDFLNGKIRPMYCKYPAAAFGSAMITSVYSIVDTAMVGQYHGPGNGGAGGGRAGLEHHIQPGTADGHRRQRALQRYARRKREERRQGEPVLHGGSHRRGGAGRSGLGGLLVFQGPVLTFFGADASMLALAERYMEPIRYVFPLFLFNQMLSAFLRNDKNPGLATLGVLSGGCSTCSEITSSYSPATWGSTVRGLPRPSAPAFPFW